MESISFFVPGIPRSGGSKTAFINKKTGKPILTDSNKRVKDWKAVVALTAASLFDKPLTGPVGMNVIFKLPRPKNHYGTGRNKRLLKSNAPLYHTSPPDRGKLLRSTEDALTGIAWRDDSQVCQGGVSKWYDETPGAWIVISDLG